METYEHKQIILSNGLDSQAFSPGLQNKINIFDRMCLRLEETVEEDREELLKKLNDLDAEITEDLENEFPEKLQNNTVELTDEDILEHYFNRKRLVLLSELRKAGFKGDWRKGAGDYSLERMSVFSYEFRVRKRNHITAHR